MLLELLMLFLLMLLSLENEVKNLPVVCFRQCFFLSLSHTPLDFSGRRFRPDSAPTDSAIRSLASGVSFNLLGSLPDCVLVLQSLPPFGPTTVNFLLGPSHSMLLLFLQSMKTQFDIHFLLTPS